MVTYFRIKSAALILCTTAGSLFSIKTIYCQKPDLPFQKKISELIFNTIQPDATEQCINGIVYLSFSVKKDYTITDVTTSSSIDNKMKLRLQLAAESAKAIFIQHRPQLPDSLNRFVQIIYINDSRGCIAEKRKMLKNVLYNDSLVKITEKHPDVIRQFSRTRIQNDQKLLSEFINFFATVNGIYVASHQDFNY